MMTTDPLKLHRAAHVQRRRAGGKLENEKSLLDVSAAQGVLPELRPSFSTDIDFTSSSTQRTSEATCSARTS